MRVYVAEEDEEKKFNGTEETRRSEGLETNTHLACSTCVGRAETTRSRDCCMLCWQQPRAPTTAATGRKRAAAAAAVAAADEAEAARGSAARGRPRRCSYHTDDPPGLSSSCPDVWCSSSGSKQADGPSTQLRRRKGWGVYSNTHQEGRERRSNVVLHFGDERKKGQQATFVFSKSR